MNKITKTFSSNIELGDDPQSLLATVTSNTIDRDGELLLVSGLNAKQYMKNPVIMLSHQYNTLPIGKTLGLQRYPDKVAAKIQFAARPADYPADQEWEPSTIFSLYQQGILNAFSIGLIPNETRPPTQKDIDTYGPDLRRVVSKYTLLEISACAIPANPDAVSIAVGKGILTEASAKKLFGDSPEIKVIKTIEAPAPKQIHRIEHVVEQSTLPVRKYVHHELPRKKLDIERMVKLKIQKLRGALYEH